MSVFGIPHIAYSYGAVGFFGTLAGVSTNPAVTAVGSGALNVGKGDLIVIATAVSTSNPNRPWTVFDSSSGANVFTPLATQDDSLNGLYMQWWYCFASQAVSADYFEVDYHARLGRLSQGLIAVWDFPMIGSAALDTTNGPDGLLDGATALPGVNTVSNDELVLMLCYDGNDFPTVPAGFKIDYLNQGGFVQWSMAHGVLTAPQQNYAPAFGSVATSDAWAIMFAGAIPPTVTPTGIVGNQETFKDSPVPAKAVFTPIANSTFFELISVTTSVICEPDQAGNTNSTSGVRPRPSVYQPSDLATQNSNINQVAPVNWKGGSYQ